MGDLGETPFTMSDANPPLHDGHRGENAAIHCDDHFRHWGFDPFSMPFQLRWGHGRALTPPGRTSVGLPGPKSDRDKPHAMQGQGGTPCHAGRPGRTSVRSSVNRTSYTSRKARSRWVRTLPQQRCMRRSPTTPTRGLALPPWPLISRGLPGRSSAAKSPTRSPTRCQKSDRGDAYESISSSDSINAAFEAGAKPSTS